MPLIFLLTNCIWVSPKFQRRGKIEFLDKGGYFLHKTIEQWVSVGEYRPEEIRLVEVRLFIHI